MVRIVYHSADLDGAASGAIAREYFEYTAGEAYTMHPYNYGQEFPFEEFERGDKVYFLDVTYQPNEDMKEFEKKYGWEVYIIDHHKTVIDSDMLKYVTGGVLDAALAGCELAWQYFYPGIKVPTHIRMLGRYDVWDQSDRSKWFNKIIPFQYGMKMHSTSPKFDDNWQMFWSHLHNLWMVSQDRDNPKSGRYFALYNDFIDETIYKGKLLYRYQKEQNKFGLSVTAFDAELMGHKVLVANTFIKNSQFFDAKWNEEEYDFMLAYTYNGKYEEYGCSIYTTREDVDLSIIAKSFGGGGHKQAAGFAVKDFKVSNGKLILTK